jgi:hypothetical protein
MQRSNPAPHLRRPRRAAAAATRRDVKRSHSEGEGDDADERAVLLLTHESVRPACR